MGKESSVIRIDPRLPYKFAALIGDQNPLHTDDNYARVKGFKGALLQGMGTFCLVAKEIIGDGDPGKLQSLEVRFEAPVYPGDKTTICSQIKDEVVHLTMWNQQGQRVLSGHAGLR